MRALRSFRIDARHAHPLVRMFYRLLAEQQVTALDVAERAGLSAGTISQWRATYAPRVGNLDAALNVLGYRLAIVPIDCTRPQDMARWERRADGVAVSSAHVTHTSDGAGLRAMPDRIERSDEAVR